MAFHEVADVGPVVFTHELVEMFVAHDGESARTNGKGQFTIPDAPLGELVLRVEHVDHPWRLDRPFELRSGESEERLIQLRAGGTITQTQ